MDSILASIIFGAGGSGGGGGGGMPTPTQADKVLVSNSDLEWEERDSIPTTVKGKFLHTNESTGAYEWVDVDCNFSTELLDSSLTEAQVLAFIVQNVGKEISGFFFNSDINAYCSFNGLYMSKIVSGTEVHYGYCSIRGIHETEYLIDYRIDWEDSEDWYKVEIVTGNDLVDYQSKIPTYTMAEYEEIKDSIPVGSLFNIKDDGAATGVVSGGYKMITDEEVDAINNAADFCNILKTGYNYYSGNSARRNKLYNLGLIPLNGSVGVLRVFCIDSKVAPNVYAFMEFLDIRNWKIHTCAIEQGTLYSPWKTTN